jgi:hypothetical protein
MRWRDRLAVFSLLTLVSQDIPCSHRLSAYPLRHTPAWHGLRPASTPRKSKVAHYPECRFSARLKAVENASNSRIAISSVGSTQSQWSRATSR